MSSNVILGIDLGTTYSCAAVYKNGHPIMIFNEEGKYTTPSCVSFTSDSEEPLVGNPALDQMVLNPNYTIYDAKRLIGRNFYDQNVQKDLKLWPFKVSPCDKNRPLIKVSDKKVLRPEQISGKVLMKLKIYAENQLKCVIKKAVISVPAYFTNAQREATIDAGVLAGLEVERIINEPTAAALVYKVNNPSEEKSTILVFDLGGGTFDVSIINIESGKFEIIATAGNTHIGGQDFTNRLMNYCIEDIRKRCYEDVQNNKKALAFLRISCEQAKKILSFSDKAYINLNYMEFDYVTSISRADFENLNHDLFKEMMKIVKKVLKEKKH